MVPLLSRASKLTLLCDPALTMHQPIPNPSSFPTLHFAPSCTSSCIISCTSSCTSSCTTNTIPCPAALTLIRRRHPFIDPPIKNGHTATTVALLNAPSKIEDSPSIIAKHVLQSLSIHTLGSLWPRGWHRGRYLGRGQLRDQVQNCIHLLLEHDESAVCLAGDVQVAALHERPHLRV